MIQKMLKTYKDLRLTPLINQQNLPKHVQNIINEQYLSLENCDFSKLMKYFSEIMSKAVDQNDLNMFTCTLNFMADLAFEMGDIDSACYFYNQCVLLGKHTLNYKLITQGYFGLSLCC